MPAGESVHRHPAGSPVPGICRVSARRSRRLSRCQCQGERAALGQGVTETLEVVPRSQTVIRTAREKVLCRGGSRSRPRRSIQRCGARPKPLALFPSEGAPLSSTGPRTPAARSAPTAQLPGRTLRARERPSRPLDIGSVPPPSRSHLGIGRSRSKVSTPTGSTATTRRFERAAKPARHGSGDPCATVSRWNAREASPDAPRRSGSAGSAHCDRPWTGAGGHPAEHLGGWSGVPEADAFAGVGTLRATDTAPTPATDTKAPCLIKPRHERPQAARMGMRPSKDAASEPCATTVVRPGRHLAPSLPHHTAQANQRPPPGRTANCPDRRAETG